MEGVTVSSYNGLKGYWKRKDYKRLNGSGSGRRYRKGNRVELANATLGSSSRRKRRFWRIKIKPRFSFSFSSPKKFFVKLRDAYVNMMIGFGNSRVFASGFGGGGGNGSVGYGFGRGPLKEYDEKMIVEIYKSLMLQRQL